MHINGDFFPKPDRKAAIFEGNQHQQAWNQGLILAAAREIASNLEYLRDVLGHIQLWTLIGAAAQVSRVNSSTHPDCYTAYWKEMERAFAEKPKIVLAADGSSVAGSDALLSKAELESDVIAVAGAVGITLVSEALRRFNNWLPAAGVQQLTLERLVSYCEASKYLAELPRQTDQQGVHTFFEPLWRLFDGQLAGIHSETARPLLERLKKLPIGVTGAPEICSLADCFNHPVSIPRKDIEEHLPWAALAHPQLLMLPELQKILPMFTLAHAVKYLEREVPTSIAAEVLLGKKKTHLKQFYGLLARLDEARPAPPDMCARISELPIWCTGAGFASAREAVLPGGFTDPIGLATLLDPEAFDTHATEFLQKRLGVKKQSVKTFIETVLPRFFEDLKAIDVKRYARLITELAEHGTLLDDEDLSRTLSRLPLVPTQDGGWNRPSNTYYHTELLVEVLGTSPNLWVDDNRLPSRRSVRNLLKALGIRAKPAAADLVRRLAHIAQVNLPTPETRESSARAFYALCEQFPEWKERNNEHELGEIDKLCSIACLPADNHEDKWFFADSLYAPYRATAFESQAEILAFKNMGRLNRDLLTALGIDTEPPTHLVIAHLRHCIQKDTDVKEVTYQVLNERAGKGDTSIAQLSTEPCIYLESLKKYLAPARVFWSAQRLGRYAYTAPTQFARYRAFLDAVGVRSSPTPVQFADILVEITSSHFTSGRAVDDEDFAIYQSCLKGLAAEFVVGAPENALLLKLLRESPTTLNLQGMPRFPGELLMLDSEWFRLPFGGDIDELLCRPGAEYAILFSELGVRNLSALAKIELDFSDGLEKKEEALEALIRDRTDCILRLLHDKPFALQRLIESKLRAVSVRSFDQVKIRERLELDPPIVSESTAVAAFYDAAENQLTLARPQSGRTWPQAFNAMFHHFLLDESGANVARLSAVCWSVIRETTIEDAQQYLTNIGIPDLLHTEETIGPESLELDSLGAEATADTLTTPEGSTKATQEPNQPREGSIEAKELQRSTETKHTGEGSTETKRTEEPSTEATQTQEPSTEARQTQEPSTEARQTQEPSTESKQTGGTDPQHPSATEVRARTSAGPKKRPKFKRRWDQALRSYVRPKVEVPG